VYGDCDLFVVTPFAHAVEDVHKILRVGGVGVLLVNKNL
jgi:hypothetical protein